MNPSNGCRTWKVTDEEVFVVVQTNCVLLLRITNFESSIQTKQNMNQALQLLVLFTLHILLEQ